jgi:superfamily II DNA helicase RecQ
MVSRETGPGTLGERAASLVRAYWPRRENLDHARDKIIIYCQTRTAVSLLAESLGCPSYTSESGTEDVKAAILSSWIADKGQPVIVATSALGIGFDYSHVRWVIQVDAPRRASAFSQESGRAGRDGGKVSSIVLLSAAWEPVLDQALPPDEEAMNLYLTQQHCSRAVVSQFLDDEPNWRWCMPGEVKRQRRVLIFPRYRIIWHIGPPFNISPPGI